MIQKNTRLLACLGAALLGAILFIAYQPRKSATPHVRAVQSQLAPAMPVPPLSPRLTATHTLSGAASPPLASSSRSATFADAAERARVVNAMRAASQSMRAKAEVQALRSGLSVRGETDGRTYAFAAWINGRPYVRSTCNRNAAISLQTDRVRDSQNDGNEGTGQIIGLWDAGSARHSHQEFSGRLVKKDTAAIHSHSTHVAGTLAAAGVNAGARGMASDADVESYDWDDDYAEVASRAQASEGEADAIPVSNHSYGFQAGWFGSTWFGTWGLAEADGFGLYDTFAALADQVSYNAPYFLLFKAAGNDRNDRAPSSGSTFTYFVNGGTQTKTYNPATDPPSDNWDQGGFDTISHDATAKNIMTVGAVNDAVSGTNRHITGATMTSFSSWGPADDGRVKPDIVANGANVHSTSSSSDGSYTSLSGTSMATPSAAGSAVLLLEHYSRTFPGRAMLSSMLKGLIIHTAVDLGRPGPDYVYGWGLMDTHAAAGHIDLHAGNTNAMRIVRGQLSAAQTNHQFSVLWNNVDPIRVTLCWTDLSGTARTGFDVRTASLVHDLDIRLVDPAGTVHLPFVLKVESPAADATQGDNAIDNVEQILLDAPAREGLYEVQVSFKGTLAADSQEFALMISGAGVAPTISHTPLQNTTNSVSPYIVEADIKAEAGLNQDEIRLVWLSSGGTSAFQNVQMTLSSNGLFSAEIPAQPQGTTVSYVIVARDANGLLSLLPAAGTPLSMLEFSVVEALSVLIEGSPARIGSVDPDYGLSRFPSGVVVNASAGLYSPPSNGVRSICTGWQGSGSVPTQGQGRSVLFTLREASALTWQWAPAYALTESSSPTSFINNSSWWQQGSTAITVVAEASILQNSNELAFIGWTVDGQRWPDATEQAENPAHIPIIDAPRQATAEYIDSDQDLDNDLIPDWWEYFHRGSTSLVANIDEDGDGFSNRSEFADRTDPRDPLSQPTAPSIAHIPLVNPQRLPAAWAISAEVSDNAGVDTVRLEWQLNGGAWQHSIMQSASGTTYTNVIPAPGVSGDLFYYRIVATDIAGLRSINGTYQVDVAYPILALRTNDLGIIKRPENSSAFKSVAILNDGHETLDWTLEIVSNGLQDDVEDGQRGWTHGGANDAWHVSTVRPYSGSNSWYFGAEPSRLYPNSAKAWLHSEPIFLASNAVFSFMQWLDTEELQDLEHAWDGAIVEISTNAGASFEQIAPVGGYPYRIFGHPASAFDDETPCFAGTGGWERVEFDLAAFSGFVELRLTFGSDGFVVEEGWYVDDFAVSPYGGAEGGWLTPVPTNGSVSSQDSGSLNLHFLTDSLTYGETRNAVLRLHSNDPLFPLQLLTVGLCNTSRRIDVYVTGEGTVTPPGPVIINAGETVIFEIVAAQYHHIEDIRTDALSFGPTLNLIRTNYYWATISVASTGSLQAVFAPNIVTNPLTEAWLAQHGLTNQDFILEAQLDQDGDGASAWHEFVAGTDPTNALHVLGLLIETASPGPEIDAVTLSWPSAAGRTYTLLGAPKVQSGFGTIADGLSATPPRNIYTNVLNATSNRVFRVRARY